MTKKVKSKRVKNPFAPQERGGTSSNAPRSGKASEPKERGKKKKAKKKWRLEENLKLVPIQRKGKEKALLKLLAR